jgi:hypothetical protein
MEEGLLTLLTGRENLARNAREREFKRVQESSREFKRVQETVVRREPYFSPVS